ncbi:MAG: hypothetical protein KC583_24685 [Myxococcales bacterium]|nr:hypothetical protein [Myxococcales bacterium]
MTHGTGESLAAAAERLTGTSDVHGLWDQVQAAPLEVRLHVALALLDDPRPKFRGLVLPLLERVVQHLRDRSLPPVLCEGTYCSVKRQCRKFARRHANDGRTWLTVAPTAQGPGCQAFERHVPVEVADGQ